MATVRNTSNPDTQDEALDLCTNEKQELATAETYQSFEGETDASTSRFPTSNSGRPPVRKPSLRNL